jgi:IclR family transcriptional regulator, acetate operon repressor
MNILRTVRKGHEGSPRRKDQPLDRAIAVLTALITAARPASVTELAAACDLPVPTVHRLAAQLEARGLVKRSLGSRKLLIGASLVRLGVAAAQAAMRSDRAHQILVALTNGLGEPCQIGVRVENEVVYIDSARTTRSAGLHFEQGRHAPLQCTSIGKLFLAEMTDEEFASWLAHATLSKLAPRTIVSKRRLKSVVSGIRRDGWAASDEEFVPGVVGCAVPIRLTDGSLLAGLGVSVPSARTSFEAVKAFLPSLTAAAREIAAAAEA